MVTMSIATPKTAAFGMMATIVPMPPTTKKPKWNIGTRIDFGEGRRRRACRDARPSVRGSRDAGCDARILPGVRNGLRFIRPLPGTNSADFV